MIGWAPSFVNANPLGCRHPPTFFLRLLIIFLFHSQSSSLVANLTYKLLGYKTNKWNHIRGGVHAQKVIIDNPNWQEHTNQIDDLQEQTENERENYSEFNEWRDDNNAEAMNTTWQESPITDRSRETTVNVNEEEPREPEVAENWSQGPSDPPRGRRTPPLNDYKHRREEALKDVCFNQTHRLQSLKAVCEEHDSAAYKRILESSNGLDKRGFNNPDLMKSSNGLDKRVR
ncbi:hypothetical protein ACFE04_005011 [Oxalis oulophora]